MELIYDNQIFANNLKEQLYKKGINGAELAKLVGVSKSIVSDWLNGRKLPRMNKIEKMCVIFNCTRSSLIEECSEPQIDALEEDILLMFRKLDNRQKIALYNSIKIMCEAFGRTAENGKKED